MRLFVAIDVSSEKLDVCFLDSHDTVLKEICLSNDVNGANAIKEDVLHFHQLYNYEKIVIGMGSTSVYSFHPSMFLTEDKDLRALDVEVVVQNPKAIRDSYRLGKVVQDSVDVVLATYARLIQTLKKQIKEIEKSITAFFEAIPEARYLTSVPGIGVVYAAGIIAEVGQTFMFPT
ncbi:transposase [Bacillus mobilis]|uniref:IS110 family transposase n=1 Tax=Bacillus mobilis TaxID=2026190 RepID=UPI001E282ACA|nr:transposase [Bacillus mobilis]MCC2463924.1 transposase [Bacillus mobilis]MCU5435053.1 transposase [Bacillus mobilis]